MVIYNHIQRITEKKKKKQTFQIKNHNHLKYGTKLLARPSTSKLSGEREINCPHNFFFFFFLSAASNKLLFIKEINEIIIEEGNKKIKTHY